MNKKKKRKINKKRLILLITPVILLIVIIGLCLFVEPVNSLISNKASDISITIDKKMYGFSAKEIEERLNSTDLVYENTELLRNDEKIVLPKNDSFADPAFDSVNDFRYYGSVIYSVNAETVKAVTLDEKAFTITVSVSEPEKSIVIDEDGINYLDSDLGLLSVNDLHLSADNLEKVIAYGRQQLESELETGANLTEAKAREEKLYKTVYGDLLSDIEGISMFTIKVEFISD